MIGLNCLTPIWDMSFGSKAGLGVLFVLEAEDSVLDLEVPGLVFGASVTSLALETSGSVLALEAAGSNAALEAAGSKAALEAVGSNAGFGASGVIFARVDSTGSESRGLNGLGAAARSANASSMSMFLNTSGSVVSTVAGLGSSVLSEEKSLPEKRSSLMLGFFEPVADLLVVFFLASRPFANSMPNSESDRPSPLALWSTMRPRDARRLMEDSLPEAADAPATDWRTA